MTVHEYVADVVWTRDPAVPFKNDRYSRAHEWRFDGGVTVVGSSAPTSVPAPLSRPDAVDPEEAVVAAASACHMLFFLAFAAKRGFTIDSYADHAVGVMTKNERGKLFLSRITLSPKIVFSGDNRPTASEIAELHHRAHEECYIANSLRAEMVVNA
jgi:organic hydroperoxide reductase OsmC/OhrA